MVVGNEKADRLSNRGTRGIRATRCNIGIPERYLEELLENWLEPKGMRQAKLLI